MLEMKTASTSSQHIKDFNANSLAKRVIQLINIVLVVQQVVGALAVVV